MSVGITSEHLRRGEELVAKARAHGGLAPLDVERFWADDELAHHDPFSPHCPQVPLGVRMSDECVFAELGVEEDWHRLRHDSAWRASLCAAYNDKAEKIVGRRLLNETPGDPGRRYPPVKGLHDIFEARNVWRVNSYWLMQSARNESQLSALLDRVERRLEKLREFLLPDSWEREKARLMNLGVRPPLYRGQRGPCTFATSIYGAEELIYLLVDNPPLADRFSDLILRAMLERARVLDEEAGYTPQTAPRGFGFADDNCCLLTPAMYERFGYPILKGVFDRYSPLPGDRRGQHSDSDMAHLLEILGRLKLTWTNFGPPVLVRDIRRHIGGAVIHGQLAPFTLMRNEREHIVAEFLRDFGAVRQTRGLVFATAGSINNGSRLTSLRLIMAAIQEYGRYDR